MFYLMTHPKIFICSYIVQILLTIKSELFGDIDIDTGFITL